MASATAGHVWNSQTVATATSTNILPSSETARGVMELILSCDAGSLAGLRVNVRNKLSQLSVHPAYAVGDATTYFVIPAGTSVPFFSTDRNNPITAVYVDGDGNTATFSGTVTGV